MTDPLSSTMVPPMATNPPFVNQQMHTTASTPPAPLATKNLVMRDFDLTLHAYFPTPMAPTKFNPISAMNQLLWTMLKDELSLVL